MYSIFFEHELLESTEYFMLRKIIRLSVKFVFNSKKSNANVFCVQQNIRSFLPQNIVSEMHFLLK